MSEQENIDTSEVDQTVIESGLVEAAQPPVEQPASPEQPPVQPEEKPVEPKPEEPKPDEPKTALQAVLKAQAEAKEKQPETGKPGAKPDGGELVEAEKEDPKAYRLSQSEWNSLPEKAKKRIGSLVTEVRTLSSRVAEYEPQAQTLVQLSTYVRESGMSQEEFTDGLKIMRLRKINPAAAYEALVPVMNELAAYVGDRLPPELQKEVDDGLVSPEMAKQLVAERNQRQLLSSQLEQMQTSQQEQMLESQRAANAQSIHSALTEQDQIWFKTDPDFKKKYPRVAERVNYLMQTEGVPDTPEKAVAMYKRARREMDEWFAELVPKRALNPVNALGASTNVSREPRSAKEAAELALAKMHQRA